ncbi:lipoate--protein ligase family protein [Neorhodopirellula lusitana]|nr:lipoate--protein ligase family protein [Neorhodopirellula lusitana]
MKPGRLLTFAPGGAAANMSTDEAISLAVASGDSLPTLRFYGWQRPTLSLGYFQHIADAERYLSGIDGGNGVEVVRRSTGGGAILHHCELTYSLSLPLADAGPGPREVVYQSVHRSVQEVLADVGVPSRPYREWAGSSSVMVSPAVVTQSAVASAGLKSHSKPDEPFLCFRRRTDEDLICSGYKVLGSAQRRVRGGVLQHGSLLLGVSPYAAVLPGINELSAGSLVAESLAGQIAGHVGQSLGYDWRGGELTAAELASSNQIAVERYAAAEWTRRR